MLVAVIDQSLGTSTSFCSKMMLPLASVMERGTEFPFDFVVGGDAGFGEVAAEG